MAHHRSPLELGRGNGLERVTEEALPEAAATVETLPEPVLEDKAGYLDDPSGGDISVEPARVPHSAPAGPCPVSSFTSVGGEATNQGPSEAVQVPEASEDEAGLKEQLQTTELVLLDMLGSGAQAEVWRGIWWRTFPASTSVITVAVKRFHSHAVGKAFDAESLTWRIRHPNLLKTFDVTTKAPYLIVSEYCEGGSLGDCVHSSKVPLSWRQRLKVLLDVAKGMEYLHMQKPCILHRDLKTGNVLLTKPIHNSTMEPTAKVSDFGLSRLIGGGGQMGTMMTRAVGTWRWMAPEVITSNHYDEKIDTFSFAMLMYEVLSRQVPYSDTVPTTNADPRLGLTIVKGLRPTVSLVQPGCPSKSTKLMEACWAQSPADRPDFTHTRQELESQLDIVGLYGQVKNEAAF